MRVRDRVRLAEQRALRVGPERVDLLRRGAEPAATAALASCQNSQPFHQATRRLSSPRSAPGTQLRLLLECSPHTMRGAEVGRVARVEEIRIERRAPALALFLEHFCARLLGVSRRWPAGCAFFHPAWPLPPHSS